MSTAFIFPGQGAQFPGMGKQLYDESEQAREYFKKADELLDFSISEVMFSGSEEELKQTKVTQPAIFIHSVAAALTGENRLPDMVAGHSVGEFSALVMNQCLSFEDALKLVSLRASAMQKACEQNPSTMAAVLGLEDVVVEDICREIQGEVVLPANYNTNGQIVISGTHKGIEMAAEKLKEAGAKRVLPLAVSGGFHSPLMAPAHDELEEAIQATKFGEPSCPVFQNVDGQASQDVDVIKTNLIAQLTAPVRWAQSVANMIDAGADTFVECGPGKVLQGLIRRIDRTVEVQSRG